MQTRMNSHLTPKRSKLRRIIQSLVFGSIEGLRIDGGEPCFDVPPRILRDIKIGSAPVAPPNLEHQDFLLQNKMVELFQYLEQLGSATVTIEVKHSQPFRIVAECSTDHQR
jgi:hypothetical protein